MTTGPVLSAGLVVRAYRAGAFPMAMGRRGEVQWFSPDPRAVLPLEPGGLRVSRSLGKRVRSGRFVVTFDRAFGAVVRACAGPRPYAQETWISPAIERVFVELHGAGLAHSVEAWLEPGHAALRGGGGSGGADASGGGLVSRGSNPPPAPPWERGESERGAGVGASGGEGGGTYTDPATGRVLAGGLYGLALGSAFFGESMFSRAADASKVCLVHLVERLRAWGFTLLDAQMSNPHMERLGVVEVPRAAYLAQLGEAVARADCWGGGDSPAEPGAEGGGTGRGERGAGGEVRGG